MSGNVNSGMVASPEPANFPAFHLRISSDYAEIAKSNDTLIETFCNCDNLNSPRPLIISDL